MKSIRILFLLTPFFVLTAKSQNNVGIGTTNPQANLHVTGTVLFDKLPQKDSLGNLIAIDAIGNLYKANYNVFNSNFWSLNGNTVTSSHFIGSTNAADLILKTSNQARVTVKPDGFVGFGISNPQFPVRIHHGAASPQLAISGRAASINFYADEVVTQENHRNVARIGFATGDNDFVYGSKKNDFIIQSIANNSSLIFGTSYDGINGIEKARILNNGNMGIGTSNPLAKLHVAGNLKIDGLTNGAGSVLVIDNNGYVFKSSTQALINQIPASETNSIDSEKVKQLELEIKDLKEKYNVLLEKLNSILRK